MSRNDMIDIEVMLHADPPHLLAILVSDDGDKANAVWLPRSQIDYDDSAGVGDTITVTLPEWLGIEKGLI